MPHLQESCASIQVGMHVLNLAKLREFIINVIFLGLFMNVAYEHYPSFNS